MHVSRRNGPIRRVLAVDAGRTTCRAAVVSHGAIAAETAVPASGTLLDPRGVELVHDAIELAVRRLGNAADACSHLVAGVAGTWAAGPRSADLAGRIATTLECQRVTVTNDVVCAFAGAFGPRGRGVLLAVGSGALALAAGSSGEPVRVDGWGPLLGDAGGGYWVGQQGLRAVLAAHDGRGRPTALMEHAANRFNDVERMAEVIAGAKHPARAVAAFCEAVLEAATDGDPVAMDVISEAVDALVSTATTAAARSHPDGNSVHIAIVGGLADAGLRPLLHEAIARRVPEASVTGAGAGALVGAATLADDCGPWSTLTATCES